MMYINGDFIKNVINLFGCDEGKEEKQLKAEALTNQLTGAMTSLGLNILYERYGEDYKSIYSIPSYLWAFRLVDKGMMPILDKRYPTLEDIYKLMEDEGYTESEINKFKNVPSPFVKQAKKNMETVVREGYNPDLLYAVNTKIWASWMGDKTIEAPLEAVTFWNNHTETNKWILFHDNSKEGGDIHEDKTEEEIKELISTLSKEFIGDVLESVHAIPVDYDEKGGQKITKSLGQGNDDDTYVVTDTNGNQHILDGKEKAIEKATEIANEKLKVQFGLRIFRKITEPDGYFAWREENREDYL